MSTPLLFTIGYEQHPKPASLVAALKASGVERLVDVRELPMSRRRGFSKTALARALKRAGMVYEHQRALGNPKPYRDMYRSGRQAQGERHYRAHLRNGSAESVSELARTLRASRTCLLCFERAADECHRSLIVEALLERVPTLRVKHL